MRIIAGEKKGMKMLGPKTIETRPITDRVKEALFSILYKYSMPDGCMVADIFCGTGSLGLESLSRGAQFVNFIEINPRVIETLNRNIEKGGYLAQSRTIRANGFKSGAGITPKQPKCDLVFVDPPYKLSRSVDSGSQLGRLLILLADQVTDEAVVSVRTESSVRLLEEYGGLKIIDQRCWGTMKITLLSKGRGAVEDD